MNGWKLTRVWKIDGKLVVAKTATEAIGIMKKYYNDNESYEPRSIVGMSDSASGYDALIADDDDDCKVIGMVKRRVK